MTSGGNSLTAAVLLIIMMKVFSVLTQSCRSTMYQAQGLCCSKCPAGNRVKTDCTETAHTSCVACEDGTHMDKPSGLKQCTHCTICDLNLNVKKKRACTTTSDTICEPRDGFYCVDYDGVHCVEAQEHKPCNPGEYISQAGTAFRDTECSVCSYGTFSDGTLKFCRPHRPCESLNLKLIRPGNATTDAQCEEQDENVVLSWVITGCLLLILLIVILIALCLCRKEIGCLKRGEKIIVHLINLRKNEEKETEIELKILNEKPV
uniref:tumor necrosis factor receptor superfamily member 14 n=1 Tax=Maylandia zebra TaxID=106582 RepID=UPI000D31D2E1|nr:tumor necrosis factor receptor superfamily member 14 [Maylandia zebra]XP_012775713.2 tumor necrosis factor receptor superfamily member 14 [Maylandia zebra]